MTTRPVNWRGIGTAAGLIASGLLAGWQGPRMLSEDERPVTPADLSIAEVRGDIKAMREEVRGLDRAQTVRMDALTSRIDDLSRKVDRLRAESVATDNTRAAASPLELAFLGAR